jgi:hypothetical protein
MADLTASPWRRLHNLLLRFFRLKRAKRKHQDIDIEIFFLGHNSLISLEYLDYDEHEAEALFQDLCKIWTGPKALAYLQNRCDKKLASEAAREVRVAIERSVLADVEYSEDHIDLLRSIENKFTHVSKRTTWHQRIVQFLHGVLAKARHSLLAILELGQRSFLGS